MVGEVDDAGCSTCTILKLDILKQLDAFKVLSSLNSGLSSDIIIQNIEGLITKYGNPRLQNSKACLIERPIPIPLEVEPNLESKENLSEVDSMDEPVLQPLPANITPPIETPTDSPKRRPSRSSKKDFKWESKCISLMQDIRTRPDAIPFLNPSSTSDPLGMCLEKIEENLKTNKYSDPRQFHKDMMQLFHNARILDIDSQSNFRCMARSLESFYEICIDKDNLLESNQSESPLILSACSKCNRKFNKVAMKVHVKKCNGLLIQRKRRKRKAKKLTHKKPKKIVQASETSLAKEIKMDVQVEAEGESNLKIEEPKVKRSRGRPKLKEMEMDVQVEVEGESNLVKRPRGRPKLKEMEMDVQVEVEGESNLVKRPRGPPKLNEKSQEEESMPSSKSSKEKLIEKLEAELKAQKEAEAKAEEEELRNFVKKTFPKFDLDRALTAKVQLERIATKDFLIGRVRLKKSVPTHKSSKWGRKCTSKQKRKAIMKLDRISGLFNSSNFKSPVKSATEIQHLPEKSKNENSQNEENSNLNLTPSTKEASPKPVSSGSIKKVEEGHRSDDLDLIPKTEPSRDSAGVDVMTEDDSMLVISSDEAAALGLNPFECEDEKSESGHNSNNESHEDNRRETEPIETEIVVDDFVIGENFFGHINSILEVEMDQMEVDQQEVERGQDYQKKIDNEGELTQIVVPMEEVIDTQVKDLKKEKEDEQGQSQETIVVTQLVDTNLESPNPDPDLDENETEVNSSEQDESLVDMDERQLEENLSSVWSPVKNNQVKTDSKEVMETSQDDVWSKIRTVSKSGDGGSKSSGLTYICTICEESFDHKQSIVRHIHQGHQVKRVKCLDCLRDMSDIRGLWKHQSICKGARARAKSMEEAKAKAMEEAKAKAMEEAKAKAMEEAKAKAKEEALKVLAILEADNDNDSD